MIEDKINKVYADLNRLRTNPNDCVKDLETISKGLVRFMKKKEGQELSDFAKTLPKRSAVPELKLSATLTKAAEKKLDSIIRDINETEEEMVDRLDRFVTGYSEIKELSDVGDVEAIMGRLLISESDPQRLYRQAIFNPEFTFIGIAIGKLEEEDITVITLADSVIEKSNKSLDEQLFTTFNYFRKYPYKAKKKLSDVKGSKDFNTSLEAFIASLNPSALDGFERHSDLDELALYFYEKIVNKELTDLSDLQVVSELAKSSIHGFFKIYVGFTKNIKSPTQIVLSLLANVNEKNIKVLDCSRELLHNKFIKNIGIFVKGEHEKETDVVVVGVDNFYAGTERDYALYMEDELNRLRNTPASYVKDVTNWKNEIDIKTYKVNAIKEAKALNESLKKLKPLPVIKNHPLLNKACEEYLYFNHNGGFYAEDDDILASRLGYYISGHKKVKAFVDTGCTRPEHFLTELLISEDDSTKASRQALLGKDFKYFGCFHNEVKGEKFTVIIFADRVEEREASNITDSLFYTINLLRTHPRTLIKHLLAYIDELQEKKKSAVQNTYTKKRGIKSNDDVLKSYEDREAFANEVIQHLMKIRTVAALERKDFLDKACEVKIKNIIDEGANNCFTVEDLRDFLSDFASNYFYISEIQGKANVEIEGEGDEAVEVFDSGLYLAKYIVDSLDISTLKNLFFFNYTKIGIAYDKESQNIDTLLVDHALEKVVIKIPVNLRQKIVRPNFTPDELEQMRYDFNRFDILEKGFIRPDNVLTFMSNSQRFMNNNPLYFEALRRINTIENNEQGINVNQFIDSVEALIKQMEDKDWAAFYEIYLRQSGKKKLDADAFVVISKELGYEMSDGEMRDAFQRVAGENTVISKDEFIKLMKIVEGGYSN